MNAPASLLSRLSRGKLTRPLRIVLYGVDGIGKSTFGASAPDPVFIGAEDGTANLDVTRFPACTKWQDVLDAIGALFAEPHDFKTVVLDSADWAELLVNEQVCAEHGVPGIESIGYGKGYVFAAEKFMQVLRGFDALVGKGMNVIVIAHAQIKSYQDPDLDAAYDRFQMKLGKTFEPRLREWADCVLFANYDTTLKQVGGNDKAPKFRGKDFGKRIIHTERRAAFDAKNRFGLPERIPLHWDAFWASYQDAISV